MVPGKNKRSNALQTNATGQRPPTRVEALLKILKANNIPASQLGTLENAVENQSVPNMTTEDWSVE